MTAPNRRYWRSNLIEASCTVDDFDDGPAFPNFPPFVAVEVSLWPFECSSFSLKKNNFVLRNSKSLLQAIGNGVTFVSNLGSSTGRADALARTIIPIAATRTFTSLIKPVRAGPVNMVAQALCFRVNFHVIEVRYERGIYLPAQDLWLDPWDAKRFAFVSHAHSDHIAPHREIIVSERTARPDANPAAGQSH